MDGLLHVSEMANYRVANVRDELKEGEQVEVKVSPGVFTPGFFSSATALTEPAILNARRQPARPAGKSGSDCRRYQQRSRL